MATAEARPQQETRLWRRRAKNGRLQRTVSLHDREDMKSARLHSFEQYIQQFRVGVHRPNGEQLLALKNLLEEEKFPTRPYLVRHLLSRQSWGTDFASQSDSIASKLNDDAFNGDLFTDRQLQDLLTDFLTLMNIYYGQWREKPRDRTSMLNVRSIVRKFCLRRGWLKQMDAFPPMRSQVVEHCIQQWWLRFGY